ncbi:MAG TPA: M55 family metallopeptidase [Candidatus Syntrophosphaera thermopropionivorans]|nr:M55 family metallopeptidase [Candidatus Syntrophosphaera thermopropionivorans]
MRIYISIDMEGIPGTFNWEQEKTNRATIQNCMFHHIQTVIESILASPQASLIEEITLADSHSAGDNLDYSITALDERINLISGCPRPRYMMPDLDPAYDQVWFLGYHSGTGALRGNMDHTYSNSRIHNIWINGERMNEALINAAYAGYSGVPVGLVSGDETLKDELLLYLPWIEYIPTKKAVAKFSAKNYSQKLVDKQTKSSVLRTLTRTKEEIPLFTFEPPLSLKIEFNHSSMADQAQLMPYTKRLDGRTIEYQTDDYAILFEAIMVLVYLAQTTPM